MGFALICITVLAFINNVGLYNTASFTLSLSAIRLSSQPLVGFIRLIFLISHDKVLTIFYLKLNFPLKKRRRVII